MSRELRVAILGAAGTIAPAIVRDLAESDEVLAMRLLDLDGDRAARVASEQGEGKANAMGIDGRSGDLANALSGCDVLVNSASYRLNLEAMRAALEAGCHYLDLGGLYWMTGRQLELDTEFRQAGLTAILGIGSSPGKTNVMAAHAARNLGVETLDAVHVSVAGRDLGPPDGDDRPAFPYALRTLIDELTMPPIAIRDGQPVEIEPMSQGDIVDFGEPIGATDTIQTLHSELRTFPDSFGCREATFRLSLPPAVLARLRELLDEPDERIAIAARDARPPSPHTVAVHRVDATAPDRATAVIAMTPPHERWGLGGGIVSTASPAAAAVRLLARARVKARGALPPERCLDPDDLFPELESRGCRFTVEEMEVVSA